MKISKLYSDKDKINEVVNNISQGLVSRSAHKSVVVSHIGGGKYRVMDGHHRVVEAIARGDRYIPTDIDKYIPDMTRTAGAYQSFIDNAVSIAKEVQE